MKYYLLGKEKVLEELNTSEHGLSSEEAQDRLIKNGRNKLEEGKKETLLKKFFMQMADPMIIMLVIAAAISAVTSFYSNENPADVFIIMFVVLINALMGVIQESKAEKAIEALKEMAAATSKVLRDGVVLTVKSEELVCGDVILLEAGDAVPADARIIESASLQIEEAALTGESVPVNKLIDLLKLQEGSDDVLLGDRKNMVYMGSTVAYGRGRAVVCSTGMQTEMGKIAQALSQATDGATPLQKKLAELGKVLTKIVVGICLFIFAFTIIKQGDFHMEAILSVFMTAVALAVAAIPEGLPAVVTITLSIGVTKMSKRNAVIRKLTAVETLGCTQIICSDKTGTLTQNKMTVVKHFGTDELLLCKAMALCSDATIKRGESALGEPTEAALVNYAASLGLYKEELEQEAPRVGEAPFDSMRKMMSTVHRSLEGSLVCYTKGAPDVLLKHCTKYLDENGNVLELTQAHVNEVEKANSDFAGGALRVLAAAYRPLEELPEKCDPETLEHDLIFIGLTGMIDPCRPEVYEAIKECRSAGIRPIMITGDHIDTAVAIAIDLGIIKDRSEAMSGEALEKITDEQLTQNIDKYSVYARVQPEHKVRIVKAWQAHGMITAMTGDGVNDAPSIKTADIGVGMGITGTDVTKNVADMVLADDNFATIVNAVEEGRKIYANIKKVIQFLLSANLSEVLSVFISSVLGFTILTPAHLLWVNMVTDCAPALALAVEEAEPNIMDKKPRSAKESIFAGGIGIDIILQGIYITFLVIAGYFTGHYIEHGVFTIADSNDGRTMAFLILSMTEMFHSLNMRSQRGSIFALKGLNWWLIGSFMLAMALTVAVIYIPPLAAAFEFTPISLQEYAIAMGMAASIVPVIEITKCFQRAAMKKKQVEL